MYTVKETAKILDVNEETVRRWIRKGELKSNYSSKKDGNKINEDDLAEFIENNPKYKHKEIEPRSMVIVNELDGTLTKITSQELNYKIDALSKELADLIRIRNLLVNEL